MNENHGKKQSKWSKITLIEYVAVLSLFINLSLAIFTYRLYHIAIIQAGTSENAVNAAFRSIKQTKEIFDIQNEPYIQINEITNVKFTRGKPISFEIKVFNLGDKPVKILNERMTLFYEPEVDSLDFIKNAYKKLNVNPLPFNAYISKEAPKDIFYFEDEKIEDQYHMGYMKGEVLLMLVGKFEYLNYINNKKRVYSFIINITQNMHKYGWQYIDTNNQDE